MDAGPNSLQVGGDRASCGSSVRPAGGSRAFRRGREAPRGRPGGTPLGWRRGVGQVPPDSETKDFGGDRTGAPWSRSAPGRGSAAGLQSPLPGPLGPLALGSEGRSVFLASRLPGSSSRP